MRMLPLTTPECAFRANEGPTNSLRSSVVPVSKAANAQKSGVKPGLVSSLTCSPAISKPAQDSACPLAEGSWPSVYTPSNHPSKCTHAARTCILCIRNLCRSESLRVCEPSQLHCLEGKASLNLRWLRLYPRKTHQLLTVYTPYTTIHGVWRLNLTPLPTLITLP